MKQNERWPGLDQDWTETKNKQEKTKNQTQGYKMYNLELKWAKPNK